MGNGQSGKCEYRQIFYCIRDGKKRTVENPERIRKVGTRKIGPSCCASRFAVWKYEGIDELEVYFVAEHSHPIGGRNVRYTSLSKTLKANLKASFAMGFTVSKIRELMIGADRGLRDRNISDRDIRAIQLEVEKDYFCFDPIDELSVSGWIRKLDDVNELLYHRNEGVGTFELAFITTIGRHTISKCHGLLCLDSTHKTTSYGYNLFTIVSQNEFGQGVPIAHLISSNGTETTLAKIIMFRKLSFGFHQTFSSKLRIDFR